MKEEWRWCAGFEDVYQVSSYGRVRSVDRHIIRKDGKPLSIKGRILKTQANSRGYPRTSLCYAGKSTWTHIHSLVAEVFLPKPPGPIGPNVDQYGINHKDGNKENNHVDNLEYITNRENVIHARKHGLLCVTGSKNGRAKMTKEEVVTIRHEYAKGARQVDLAEQYGIDQTQISRIVRRESWPHVK